MSNNEKSSLIERFKNRIRPPKPWIIVMAIAAIGCSFLLVYVVHSLLSGPSPEGGGAETQALKAPVETTPGGEASEAYKERVEGMNTEQAKKALKEGESFMPMMVRSGENDDLVSEDQDEEPPEKEEEEEEEPKEEESSGVPESRLEALQERMDDLQRNLEEAQSELQEERRENERLRSQARDRESSDSQAGSDTGAEAQSYSGQMDQIASEMSEDSAGQEVISFENKSDDTGDSEAKAKETEESGSQNAEGVSDDEAEAEGSGISLSPGDILYARNELRLDSDSPGPAQATVVSGDLKGAKLMGNFDKESDYLQVKFNRIALPNGEVHDIEGLAIDPEVPASAVRSDVDRHMLQRWGGLMGASFLSGIGEAIRQSGSKISHSDGQTVSSTPEMDTEEQLWSAGGRVGEALEKKFERSFERPSTVTLKSGVNIGILILSAE